MLRVLRETYPRRGPRDLRAWLKPLARTRGGRPLGETWPLGPPLPCCATLLRR